LFFGDLSNISVKLPLFFSTINANKKNFVYFSMRNILLSPQLSFGQTYIGDIKINLDSRDDIPRILLGLQSVYEETQTRQVIESILASVLSDKQINTGRQGMDMWRVFVLGIMRLNLNCDYDRLHSSSRCIFYF
jgi:hypothetical protein